MLIDAVMVASQPLTARQPMIAPDHRPPSRSRSLSKLPSNRRETEMMEEKHAGYQMVRGRSHRRSRSSMRYPPRKESLESQQQDQKNLHTSSSHRRPRPVSTGRLRDPQQERGDLSEDPAAVTRAIMDLREKRENQFLQKHQRSSSNRPRASSKDRQQHQTQQQGHPITIQRSHSQQSNSSQENHYQPDRPSQPADRKEKESLALQQTHPTPQKDTKNDLKQAEVRIDGLLQDLEELRFFQELDEADPSPPKKVLGAKNMSTRPTPRNEDIPKVIRTVASPVRGHPPPPPALDLSPRKISRMERTELELETQTLVRKLQIMSQEKHALESTVEMYEVTMQDQSHASEKVRQLEAELRQLSGQLKNANLDMEQARGALVSEYEARLKEKVDKLQHAQKAAETYKSERDKFIKELEKRKAEHTERKAQLKDELRVERNSFQAKEVLLKSHLNEASTTLEEFRDKVAAKDVELGKLREELVDAGKTLDDVKTERDATLGSLREKLSQEERRYCKVKKESDKMASEFVQQERQLEKARLQLEEQTALITDMTSRLDSVHTEYRAKFSELKEAYEAKEKRRLNEMVVAQSSEVEEYERRVLALQEQLTHATDRHHAEMKKKDEEIESKLEAQRSSLQREIQLEHGDQVNTLELELAAVRRELEQTEAERRRLDLEFEKEGDHAQTLESELEAMRKAFDHAESERRRLKAEAEKADPRDTFKELKEWELHDSLREKEMQRLREKSERLVRELSEKEEEIQQLSTRLSESESASLSRVNELEAKHAGDLITRDEHVADQKKIFRSAEIKLRNELANKETELEELRVMMDNQLSGLQQELDQTRFALNDASEGQRVGETSKGRLEKLQAAHERLQDDMAAAKSKHERSEADLRAKIVKMDATLRANEATLKQKNDAIKEIEENLRNVLVESEKSSKKLNGEISALRSELLSNAESRSQLVAEVKEKKHELEKKEERLKELDASIRQMQKEFADEKAQKMTHAVEVTDLQKECERLRESLGSQHVKEEENRNLAAELARKEKQANQASATFSSTVSDLESKLSDERKAKQKLLQRMGDLESELESKGHQASAQLSSTVSDLESSLREERKAKEKLIERTSELESELELKEQQVSRLPKLQNQLNELIQGREELQAKLNRVKAEMERKENSLTRTLERHSRTLSEYDAKLEEQNKAKEALQAQLRAVESELEMKSSRLERQIPELNKRLEEQRKLNEDLKADLEAAEAVRKVPGELQAKIDELIKSKAETEAKLHSVEAELEARSKKLEKTNAELQNELKQQKKAYDSLQWKLAQAESEQEKMASMSSALAKEYTSKIEELMSSKDNLEAKLRDLEEEREDREKQMKESSERYSNRIVELQMKTEELAQSKASLKRTLLRLESELEQKESELEEKEELASVTSSQQSADFSKLQLKLSEQLADKERLQARLEEVESQLKQSADKVDRRALTELQRKCDSEAKEKRSLRLKIGDIEAELARKEKQVGEIVNKYSQEISELESQLADQSRTKSALQKEVERLRRDAMSISDACSEAGALRDRVVSLEKSVELERALNRDEDESRSRLEQKLVAYEKENKDLNERLVKSNGERTEVITALEELIKEVQSREEEIESLANILRQRDEELEHAKMIATKALASAQEIKSRYKEQGSERHSELSERITELNASLDFLTSKHDRLKRRTTKLEHELQQKETECTDLKDKLRRIEGVEKKETLDEFIAKDSNKDGFSLMNDGFTSFDETSPTHSLETMSTQSGDLGGNSGGSGAWLQEFDAASHASSITRESMNTNSRDSFSGARTESSHSQSRRSIERDALRKYVRKRYLRTKSHI